MRTQPWVLASAFALAASVASAEPERPRIYYPRAIKRQIGNITSDELPEPASTTTIESSTRRGILDELLEGVIGGGDSTTSSKSRATTTDEDEDEDDETGKGGIIIGPTGIKIPGLDRTTKSSSSDATPTKAPASTSESASDESSSTKARSSSSSKLIDLDPILTELLPDPTSTNATDDDAPTSTVTSGSGSSSAVTPSSSSSSSSGLLDDLTSLLPLPTSSETSAPIETSTSDPDDGVSTSLSSSSFQIPPTPTSLPPLSSSTEVPSSTFEPPEESSSSELPPIETPTIPVTPTESESSELPITNTTDSEPTPEPTDVTSASDIASASVSASESSSADEPIATPTSAIETEAPVTSSEAAPTTLSTVAPSKKPETTAAQPTTTDDPQDDWLPSTIVQEATSFSFTRPTAEPTGTSTSIPSNVPKVILSNEPEVKQPQDTTAIQIGFLYPLNWGFVSKNTVAAAQLFRYLPEALADAGGFPQKNVVVTKLIPMDTNHKWGFTTTIATLWYPTDSLDSLQMQLNAANSKLYNNDKDIINSLTSVINKNIDLFGNIGEENGDANGDNGEGGNGGDDTFDSNDSSGTTAQDRARTAGIAVGALSLAGLYGAAMFIVARRYKRKRQGHQRASSLTSSQASSEMRYTGTGSPALMGGALMSRDVSSYGGLAAGGRDSHGSGQSGAGNSARTANISAPVATENSLGWN